jgi:hypothetical protein
VRKLRKQGQTVILDVVQSDLLHTDVRDQLFRELIEDKTRI